jgi:hypothetical protein
MRRALLMEKTPCPASTQSFTISQNSRNPQFLALIWAIKPRKAEQNGQGLPTPKLKREMWCHHSDILDALQKRHMAFVRSSQLISAIRYRFVRG